MIAIVSTSSEKTALAKYDWPQSKISLFWVDEYLQKFPEREANFIVDQLFSDIKFFSRAIFYKPFIETNNNKNRLKADLINRFLRIRLSQEKTRNAPVDINAVEIHRLSLLDQWALLLNRGVMTPEFMFSSDHIKSDFYYPSNPRNFYKWAADDLTDSKDLNHFFKFSVRRPASQVILVSFYRDEYLLKTNFESQGQFPKVRDFLADIRKIFGTDFGELILFSKSESNLVFGGLSGDFAMTTPKIIFDNLRNAWRI
jgi:hypothetical protein